MRRPVRWLALLPWWLAAAVACAAPYDLVPRGDWSYDALAAVARRGVLPGVSARSLHGDELRTRAEIAAWVVQATERAEDLPPDLRAILRHLVSEYRPELGARAAALLKRLEAPARGAVIGGYLLGRVFTDSGTGTNAVFRAAGTVSLNRYALATTSVTDERRLWSEKPNAFTDLERLTLRLETRYVTWELGQRDEYWGPGYGGAMLLSDNAPGFLALRGEALLKLGFLGTWDYTQLAGTFTEEGRRKYVAARRASHMFSQRLGLAFAEGVKTDTARRGYFALFLPFFAYGKLVEDSFGTPNRTNYLGDVNLWYSTGRILNLYGDLVLDDITAPFNLGPVNVARKIGYRVGAQIRPERDSDRTELRLEYALTDGNSPGFPPEGGTYWHRNPSLTWFHDGLTLGDRMGRNRHGPFARLRHRFTNRVTGIAEWEDETQFRATPVVGDLRRLTLYGAYDLKPDRSLALRVDHLRGALGHDTRVQLQGAYSF
jgi:Capsule assembly protein Wzi